ncbi:MAG: class I SAM-dependent methyltransferase [Actinobacteria bacterium]|nr:class I SAM-dependent methyltransferase [Actinomycetota bacterium]
MASVPARARAAAGAYRRHRDLRVLPPVVAWYLLRARLLAERRDEDWARFSSLPTDSLARLLDLAGGARHVVELGTAMGWTTGALALARPDRTVTSYDVVRYDGRAHYLGLLGSSVRARIELVSAPGASGPPSGGRSVDLVFVDASHDRAQTAAEFAAWRPAIGPGGLVAFHDYRNPDFPGVAEAIHDDLGLAGEAVGDLFVWRNLRVNGL